MSAVQEEMRVRAKGTTSYPPGTTTITLVVPPGVEHPFTDEELAQLADTGVLVTQKEE